MGCKLVGTVKGTKICAAGVALLSAIIGASRPFSLADLVRKSIAPALMVPLTMLDEEFKKQRARTVRDLADKAADPFIKRRLQDLAARYEDDGLKHPTTLTPIDLKLESRGTGTERSDPWLQNVVASFIEFQSRQEQRIGTLQSQRSSSPRCAIRLMPISRNWLCLSAATSARALGPAVGHYQQALILNPRHRSAHER
jgi:hypothetical protein